MSVELLLSLFVQYGYWIVFVGILLDNAGVPIPGELFLLILGTVARTGDLDLRLGVLVAWAAAMSGDSVAYWLGRLGGERLLHTYCRVTLGSGKCVQKAVAFYQVRGKVAVVFGRFVIGVRAFLFPLAGSARMPYAQFLFFDSLGALIWSGLFILAGYSVGWQVERAHDGYRAGSAILAAVLGVGFATYLLMKLYRRWRHGQGSLRGRMVLRVRKALQPRGDTGLRAFISRPPEIMFAARNGPGPTDQQPLLGGEGVAAREAQARRNAPESPRPPEAPGGADCHD